VRAALPAIGLEASDVHYAFAGLYPLIGRSIRTDVYQGTGEYQIVDHAVAHAVDGYVSVLGAKYTTARRVAERAVDLIVRKLGRSSVPCATRTTPLAGGNLPSLTSLTEDLRRRSPDLDVALLDHLIEGYGTDASAVLRVAGEEPGGLRRLADNRESIEAEVAYAVEHEMAIRLDDVVFRRTGLGTVGHPGSSCLRRCADIMKGRLGWPADRVDEEIRRTERLFSVRPDPGQGDR
jgi:glycerol-3-phosphate dehydrogenase